MDSTQERMVKVIQSLHTNAIDFGKSLGYKSVGTIYHVVNGLNGISQSLIFRIITKYPSVSFKYLKEGVGPVLLTPDETKEQIKMFDLDVNIQDNNKENSDEKLHTLIMLTTRQNELLADVKDILKQLLEVTKNK